MTQLLERYKDELSKLIIKCSRKMRNAKLILFFNFTRTRFGLKLTTILLYMTVYQHSTYLKRNTQRIQCTKILCNVAAQNGIEIAVHRYNAMHKIIVSFIKSKIRQITHSLSKKYYTLKVMQSVLWVQLNFAVYSLCEYKTYG